MNYRDLIAVLSAMLTPTIALITTYIAIQQFRSNRLKQRLEVYDRRLAVYNATMKVIRGAAWRRDWGEESVQDFLTATEAAHFLFDEDVNAYLASVYEKLASLKMATNYRSDDKSTYRELEREGVIGELCNWLGKQETEQIPRQLFAKYLSLKKLK